MIGPPLAVDQARCADRDGGPGRVPDCGEVGGVSLRGTGGPAGRWWVEGVPGVLPVGGCVSVAVATGGKNLVGWDTWGRWGA